MIESIRHIGIVVHDMEKSKDFWINGLGLKIININNENGIHVDKVIGLSDVSLITVKLESPCGMVVELLHFLSHPNMKSWNGNQTTTGITHIALQVNDIDGLLKKLEKYEYKPLGTPQIGPDKFAKTVYTTGPENIILELVELL
jgi:catechol-2,3-dioxygenase